MRKNSALFAFMSIFLALSVQAMEYPEKETKKEVSHSVGSSQVALVLASKDGKEFALTQEEVLQSPMLVTFSTKR